MNEDKIVLSEKSPEIVEFFKRKFLEVSSSAVPMKEIPRGMRKKLIEMLETLLNEGTLYLNEPTEPEDFFITVPIFFLLKRCGETYEPEDFDECYLSCCLSQEATSLIKKGATQGQ